MSEALDQLARAYGILSDYVSETGERRIISDEAKRRLLAVMGVPPRTTRRWQPRCRPRRRFRPRRPSRRHDATSRHGSTMERVWGVSCQLYSLRSARNLGIGDFADLAAFADIAAAAGADFIGEPAPCPVRRRSRPLQPLCSLRPPHARLDLYRDRPDRGQRGDAGRARAAVPGGAPPRPDRLPRGPCLEARPARAIVSRKVQRPPAFQAWREAAGPVLQRFALFEALSEWMVTQGFPAGWHGWPAAYQDPSSTMVSDFANDNAEAVAFHCWLQWLANEQLAAAASCESRRHAHRPLSRSGCRRCPRRRCDLGRSRPRGACGTHRRPARHAERSRPGLGSRTDRAGDARRPHGAAR